MQINWDYFDIPFLVSVWNYFFVLGLIIRFKDNTFNGKSISFQIGQIFP